MADLQTSPQADPEAASKAFRSLAGRVREELSKVIVGHAEAIDEVITALFAGGHVLIEGAPGIGKTRLVKTLAKTLSLSFKRIQFTPDLMPADITGGEVLSQGGTGAEPAFRFQPGPIFAQVVLADEINRATPKTQAALLEAMQEGAVTTLGTTRQLPRPFFVLATQNPIEMAGTYPLPEAQLDRFMLKLVLNMPSEKELVSILERTTEPGEPDASAAATPEEVLKMQELALAVPVASPVREYAARLVLATHPQRPSACDAVKRYVRYGASPRGAQALVRCAKVRALMSGRMHVGFSDIKAFAPSALRHRLVLNLEAHARGVSADAIVSEVVASVKEG